MSSAVAVAVDDRWVPETELRRYLGVSATTMTRWRAAGLPHVGTFRLRRYHLPAVMEWLTEHRWAAPPAAQPRRRLRAAG